MSMSLPHTRVLVSGGAGFIGSHIVDRLLGLGVEVGVLDNFTTGRVENLAHHIGDPDFSVIKGDIRDFESAKKDLKGFDAVVHLAAMVSVVRSVEDPILTNETNVTGTLNLLRASVDFGIKRFVYASSSSVYGEEASLPKRENAPTKPVSPYGTSKYAAETYSRVFNEVYSLDTVCLRYFNVYGPRQTPGPYSGVISIFIDRLLRNETPIIFGDGHQTRDFTNVGDAADATILALSKESIGGEVFNIATGVPTSVNELAQLLQEITGKTSIKPMHTAPRPGDIRHSYADIEKARRSLGYEPKISLRDGLRRLVEWYKNEKPSWGPA